MKRAPLFLLFLAAGGACFHGPNLAQFEPAHSPAGVATEIRVDKVRIRGELLEVQDTALVVLTDSGRVTLIRYDDIYLGKFKNVGALIFDGRAAKAAIARLRSVSRFPAGMTPRIRAELLAAYGQTAFQVVP
jgi:hypothetical protein